MPSEDDRPAPNQNKPTLVQSAGEKIARRELLRRGGKFVGALAFFGAVAGTRVSPAFARSPDCSTYGCACNTGTCYQNGNVCTIRYGDCPSGGYCWSEACGSDVCTYCDYFCFGHACTCLKVTRPGKPPGSPTQGDASSQIAA